MSNNLHDKKNSKKFLERREFLLKHMLMFVISVGGMLAVQSILTLIFSQIYIEQWSEVKRTMSMFTFLMLIGYAGAFALTDFTKSSSSLQEEQEGSEGEDIKTTIAELLVNKKSKNNSIAYLVFILSSVVYYLSSYLFGIQLHIGVFFFNWLMILFLFISQYSLNYRIKKGLYGSNEYEAKEIIRFILSHAEKTDFSDGSRFRDLLPKPDIHEGYSLEPVRGISGAEA